MHAASKLVDALLQPGVSSRPGADLFDGGCQAREDRAQLVDPSRQLGVCRGRRLRQLVESCGELLDPAGEDGVGGRPLGERVECTAEVLQCRWVGKRVDACGEGRQLVSRCRIRVLRRGEGGHLGAEVPHLGAECDDFRRLCRLRVLRKSCLIEACGELVDRCRRRRRAPRELLADRLGRFADGTTLRADVLDGGFQCLDAVCRLVHVSCERPQQVAEPCLYVEVGLAGGGVAPQLVETVLDRVEALGKRPRRSSDLVPPRVVRGWCCVREQRCFVVVLLHVLAGHPRATRLLLEGSPCRCDIGPLDGQRARQLQPGDGSRFDEDLSEREPRLLLPLNRRGEVLLRHIAVLEQDLADRPLRRGRRWCGRALHFKRPGNGDCDAIARGDSPRGGCDAATMLLAGIGTPLVRVIHPSKGHAVFLSRRGGRLFSVGGPHRLAAQVATLSRW